MDRYREYDGVAVGGRIASLRKRLGLTQEQFAEALGVTSATIRRMESGERGPSKTVLFRISQCFDVSLDALADPDVFEKAAPGFAADHGGSAVGEESAAYYAGPLPEGVRRGGAFGNQGAREKEKLKALIGASVDEMPVEIARQAAVMMNTLRLMCRSAAASGPGETEEPEKDR